MPDLTAAQAARVATLAMGRRPTPTVHDVALTGPQRALVTFKHLQPRLAARFADAALLVAAQGRRAPTVCRWHLARAMAKRWALPAPRYTAEHRALLGEPCGAACRAAILPRPKPKPKPRPAAKAKPKVKPQPATAQARPHTTSTSRLPRREALVAATRRGMHAAAQDYNLARARALGLRPGTYEHLTGGRT